MNLTVNELGALELGALAFPSRDARKFSALAISLQDKLEAQKSIKSLEATRTRKRKELFESQDNIDQQRDGLIAQIEQQMQQNHAATPLFTIRWTLAG